MSLPSHVRTTIDQAAITKVTRMFNGTLADALAELLQNARRAGATTVHIEQRTIEGREFLTIRDDGAGIDDPRAVVTFGKSGWKRETMTSEDPAGMGMFSLAGRYVVIRSHSRTAGHGWGVAIRPEEWENAAEMKVERCGVPQGTEITVELCDSWQKELQQAVRNAARYYPLRVVFEAKDQDHEDFLQDAVHIEDWNGVRIGIFRKGNDSLHSKNVNFHGVTAAGRLPTIGEQDRNSWHARVGIVNAPQLQLVLPARKEMVQNAALGQLRDACTRAIFRAIALQPSHRLSFAQWQEARNLGIEIPEADPFLTAWSPSSHDSGNLGRHEHVRDPKMVIMPDLEPGEPNTAARAFTQSLDFVERLVEPNNDFEGYDWYDALRRIEAVELIITDGERTYRPFTDETDPESLATRRVDAILMRVSFVDDALPIQHIPTDVLIIDTESWGSLKNTHILLTQDATIGVDALVDLLQAAVFSDSDDSAADSYETQEIEFRLAARKWARTLLLGDDRAIIERIEEIIRAESMVDDETTRSIALTIGGGKVSARYVEPPLEPA